MAVLETKSAETSSSHEVYGIISSGRADETGTRSVFATTEDDPGVLKTESKERITNIIQSIDLSMKEEEPDEDPSYRQFLA